MQSRGRLYLSAVAERGLFCFDKVDIPSPPRSPCRASLASLASSLAASCTYSSKTSTMYDAACSPECFGRWEELLGLS